MSILYRFAVLLALLFVPDLQASPLVVPTHEGRQLGLARQHLAEILQIATREITLEAMDEVRWPDTCLGLLADSAPCQPRSIPGYHLTFRVGKKKYSFHTDRSENIRYAGPLKPFENPPANVSFVRSLLAAHLKVPAEEIELLDLEEIAWPDTCLGLPSEELCLSGETPGHRILLQAGGQVYRFHTGHEEMFRFAGPAWCGGDEADFSG